MKINKVLEAIRKINPDAQASITDEDLNTIRWENGTAPISISAIQAQIPVVEQEIADAAAKKIADKASADTKLKALGLTDDEIEAFRS
jgi:predicted RNA binding protein with dsRBD fold (UPF0201 family)|tara:strand:- start:42 stop:305 length:264 start_codon:yes stop_codon:yes gene_type:complete